MEQDKKLLSDITVFGKYSRYLPEEGRRETWKELILRNRDMHVEKYPDLEKEINEVYERTVLPKKALPSMRSLQFGGTPIARSNSRIYNCAYLPIEDIDAFSEIIFLLLGGTGVGYSVQKQHVAKLPIIQGTTDEQRKFLIGDSIEGWSDAVKVLVEAHFLGKSEPIFDYSDIREKGSELITSGGKAPGPEPLRLCLEKIASLLRKNKGNNLTPLGAHDMACHLADAVLAGGIRRAAMISLFSPDDEEMLTCKSGEWWERNPQRGRANNSVSLLRGSISEYEFKRIWKMVEFSGAGEPGVYWTNNLDWGTNPCCEIALKPYQFCNLVELNASDIKSQEDLDQRASDATLLATLQAGYTDFHYLRGVWRKTTEEDALIGVGITGIASNKLTNLNLSQTAEVVKNVNEYISKRIGVNPAARCTTIKPSGTSSLVMGTSSGIHAWHNDYYVRRIRFGNDEPIMQYLKKVIGPLTETDQMHPTTQSIICIPQKAPEGSTVRTESPLELLGRVHRFNVDWVAEGHRRGDNRNNVSCTISLKPEDWEPVGQWMWDNRSDYNGISVLPYDGGTYVQAPFTDITKEEYEDYVQYLADIDLTQVYELVDNTEHTQEAACAGGQCEI